MASSPQSDEVAHLAKYLPSDTHVVTTYDEAVEVMRHVKMRTESLDKTRSPFLADTVHDLHAADHIIRRRTMNRLVRPDALERYREEITLRTLLRRLRRVKENPDLDGKYRTDLLKFSKLVFIQFAAAIVGIDATTEEDATRLEDLVDAMNHAMHSKWFNLSDPNSPVAQGLSAKGEFRNRYLSPALARCPVNHGGVGREETPNLVALFAALADPAWQSEDLTVREALAVVDASVETSSSLITSAVDELNRWLTSHPEDRGLTGDLDFLALVVQETLRLRPSSLPFFDREAAEDIVLSTTGRVIKRDERVAVVMRSANLDPTVFGPDASEFNPRRKLPPAVPRYGISFGAGQHQCLGLRVILGNDGIGSHAHILRTYLAAGVTPDPDHSAEMESSDRSRFREYPVIFASLGAVTG